MKSCFFALILSLLILISCAIIAEENDTINYEVNEDYLADDGYPFRIENESISSIVFHYTAQSYKKSLRALTTGENSSHWLVPVEGDTIYKIVNENRRARHAGTSLWKNRRNVNVISIGVEVVNLGFKCKNHKKYCEKDDLDWFEFPEKQQKLIISLAKNIQKKYNIDPLCVVAHSDIAIDRKLDPGPLFPWKKLAENGVGAWVTDSEIQKEISNIQKDIQGNISNLILQVRLYEFGYDIGIDTGIDTGKNRRSNKYVQNKIIKYEYNMKKTPISDLSALNKLNKFGNANPKNNIFDDKKTNFAIQTFLMHYLPQIYLAHKGDERYTDHYSKHNPNHKPDLESDEHPNNNPNYHSDNLKILATLQALLIKYPKKARNGCSF